MQGANFVERNHVRLAIKPEQINLAVIRQQLLDLCPQVIAVLLLLFWRGRRKLDRFEVQPQVGQIGIAFLGAAIQKRMILAGKVPIGRRIVEADLQSVAATGLDVLLHQVSPAHEIFRVEITVGAGP